MQINPQTAMIFFDVEQLNRNISQALYMWILKMEIFWHIMNSSDAITNKRIAI